MEFICTRTIPQKKNDYLEHHGILGQKWGVRRFQNPDGTLTEAGKKKRAENYTDQQRTRDRKFYGRGAVKRINKRMLEGEDYTSARHSEVLRKENISRGKKWAGRTAVVATALGTAYAAYRFRDNKYVQTAMNVVKYAVGIDRDPANIVNSY